MLPGFSIQQDIFLPAPVLCEEQEGNATPGDGTISDNNLHDMTSLPVISRSSRIGTPTSSVSDAGIEDLPTSKRSAPRKDVCGKGTKVRNFTKDEDFFLSKAYVQVSLDPIRGNDQKSGDLWSQVYKTYMVVYKNEAEVQEEDMTGQNMESIKSRFQRNIQKDVVEYCACCRTNEVRSGETSDDFLARMERLFEEKKGKPFRFRHCLNVLRAMPKFDCETKECGNVDKVVDNFLDGGGDIVAANKEITPEKSKDGIRKTSYSNQASGTPRPQGTKAAKRQVVDNYIDNKLEEKKIRILEDVAVGLNDMAGAIQRKQEREHLHSMLMIYQSLGDHQKVKEYLQLLESLPRRNISTNILSSNHANVAPDLPLMWQLTLCLLLLKTMMMTVKMVTILCIPRSYLKSPRHRYLLCLHGF